MARRLVWMPVLPRITVSAAANLRESAGKLRACRANTLAGKKAAPAAQAVRWRNSRRFMGPPSAVCRCWLSIISTREQNVRLSVAEGDGDGSGYPGKEVRREASSLLDNLPTDPLYMSNV